MTEIAEPRVLVGYMSLEAIKAEFGIKSDFTIRRWQHDGMPFVKIGQRKYFDPAAVRAWVLARQRQPAEEPKRGRPRKCAA